MIKSPFKILLIEGNSEDFQLLQSALGECHTTQFILDITDNLYDAVDLILKGGIDLILLDLSTPDSNGFEILKALRARSIALPIIVLTLKDEEEMGLRALNEGAQDYIFKNTINEDSFVHSIKYAIDRFKITNELRMANLKLSQLRQSAIEEERLKGLLKLSGSTAHELNQSLTALMGSICLMRIEKDDPEKISRNMERIESSGKRISEIITKLQAICHDRVNENSEDSTVADISHVPNLHKVEHTNDNFKNLNNLLRIVQSRYNGTAP